MLSDTSSDTLNCTVHEEFDGYYSLEKGLYYCPICKIHADHELVHINYHSISENFPHISPSKCCLCNRKVSLITPIIDCRPCFLNYLEEERKREFARARQHE